MILKNLDFDYYMQIDYSKVVAKCNYTVKCIPQDTCRQKIEDLNIDIYPNNRYSFGVDGLGNKQVYGGISENHDTFYVHITGKATTGFTSYEEIADDGNAMIFRQPHGLNVAGDGIRGYFKRIMKDFTEQNREENEFHFMDKPNEDLQYNKQDVLRGISIRMAEFIMHKLHKDFCYEPCVTNVNTTAEEAFLLGKGVCQDYAHILISLLHEVGIVARYVTGLIIGEGQSHAWVEILNDGKWYGYDPTNDKAVTDDYIKIGVGRDAKDCMINRGIMQGGGLHVQKINVKVKESAEVCK